MDIHALQEWSDKWLLCFHPEKCRAMRIGKSRIDKMDYHQWSMYNQRYRGCNRQQINIQPTYFRKDQLG
jgi:hypothetical protein